MVEDEVDPVKSLYRQLIRSKNPEVSGKFKKYGYNQFREKLTTDQEAKDDLANYLVDKGEVKSQEDFYGMVDVRAPKATVSEPEEPPTKVLLPVPRAEAPQNPAMDALDPSLTQHAPSAVQEKPGIIQTFKDTWGGTRQIVEPLIQHGKDIAKGIQRGWAQGEAIQKAPLTDLATGSEKVDFKGIAEANRKVKDMGQTGAEADFATSTGTMDDITDYAKMVLPVVSESIATLIRSGVEEAGVGAATGAGLGSVVPGVGTVAGAGTGAAAGMAQAGYNMELYASIMDGLEEKGIDTGDEAQLKAAFADKSLMEPILSKANKRAAIIAGVDLVGGAAANSAGRALRAVEHVSPLGKILSRTAKIAGKADDALTGGTGEAAAQLATEGKINPQEVALETVGGAPLAGAIREGLNVNGSSFFKKKTAQAEAAQLALPAGPDSPEQTLIDGTKPEQQRLPAGPNTPRLLPPAPPSAIEGARDAVVDQIQSRGSVDIEQFNPLNAVPETVVHTTDRLDNDIPVDPIQINEAMDWFYNTRKQVLDMRNDPNRMLTIGQINGIVEDIDGALHYIGDAKANLENSEGQTVRGLEVPAQEQSTPITPETEVNIPAQELEPEETTTIAEDEQTPPTPLPQQTNADGTPGAPETEPNGTEGVSAEVVTQEPSVDTEGVEGVGEPIVRENDVPLTKEEVKEGFGNKSNFDSFDSFWKSFSKKAKVDENGNWNLLNTSIYEESGNQFWPDLILKDTKENRELAKKYNAKLVSPESLYSDSENDGLLEFKTLKDAASFIWETDLVEKQQKEFEEKVDSKKRKKLEVESEVKKSAPYFNQEQTSLAVSMIMDGNSLSDAIDKVNYYETDEYWGVYKTPEEAIKHPQSIRNKWSNGIHKVVSKSFGGSLEEALKTLEKGLDGYYYTKTSQDGGKSYLHSIDGLKRVKPEPPVTKVAPPLPAKEVVSEKAKPTPKNPPIKESAAPVGKEAPQKSNTDKAIDYLQSLLDETDNAAGLNAEFYRTAIKGMIAAIKAGKTVANAISEAIDYLVGKGENRDEVVAALEKHRKPLEALVPTAESGPDKVEKKVLNRAFRGTTDADVKKAIEKLGLYRTPESQDQALERGRQLVEELGVEGALQAARTNANNMNGMTVAAIYGAAIEDVYLRSQEAETAEEHIALVNQQAAIVAEASGEGTWAGQFIGMLPKIYESGEVPYDYEAKVKEYKTEFGSISPEVEARMKAADEALQEANKKIFELNKKLREQEAAEAPGNIKEAIEREKKERVPTSVLKDLAKKFRSTFQRKGVGIFQSATPGSLVWDGAVEAVALALEAGGSVEVAVKKGLDHIRNSDWYKNLTKPKQGEAEDTFAKEMASIRSEGAEMVNGDIKVPHSLMRYYVEQGMTDIDEIAKAIKDDLNDDNLTIRDIRDAITGYGKKVNRTKPQIAQDITDLKRIGKKLSLLEDLQKGIKKEKNEAKKRVLSDREAQLQKELDAFSVKKFGEKTPMDKYKERTQKQIDELNRKVSEKDFSTKTRTPQTEFDEAALKLYGEREAAKDKYDYEFEKARLEQRTTDQKRGDALLDVIGLTKSLKASFDMSAPLRQGLVILGSQSPMKSAKDLKFMFQSVADIYRGKKDKEDHYHKWLAELKGSKDWPLMKEAGLFIAQEDPRMIAREEAFATNLLREIPILEKDYKGVKGLKLATASEIAYNAFLNHQRVQAFREGVEALKDAGKSFESDPTEYKSLANYINVATGRADLKNVGPKAMKWLNVGFFSPRFMAARLQSLNPTKYYFMPPTARKLALIRDAKFLATVATLVGLMAVRLKDDDDDETDIELNPKSPDFLKVKLGDTKIDAFGGYGGYFSMLAQIASGERKNRKTGEVEVLGKKYGSLDETDVAKDFLLGKLAPVPGAFLNFKLAQENEDGQLVNRFGEEVTLKNTVIDLTAPLYLSDAKEIWSNHRVPTATALSVMAFFGAGVNTAQKRALTNAQSVAKALNPGDKEQSESKKLLKSAIESGDNESIQKQFKAYRADKTPYTAAKEIWKEVAQDKLNDKYGVETKYTDNLLRFLFKNKPDERIKVGKEMKYVRDVISQEQADGLRVAYKEQLEKRRSAEKILSQLGGQDFSKKHLKGDWSRYVK